MFLFGGRPFSAAELAARGPRIAAAAPEAAEPAPGTAVPGGETVQLSTAKWGTRWTDRNGLRHRLTVRDDVSAGEWSRTPMPSRGPGRQLSEAELLVWKSLQTGPELPRPLPARWWWPRAACRDSTPAARDAVPLAWADELEAVGRGNRCSDRYCEPCRVRSLARSLGRARAAVQPLLQEGCQVWLVTATRTQYARRSVDLYRFKQAVRMLDASLRFAGALGAVWVMEVKVKPTDGPGPVCHHPADDCSGEGTCPLCSNIIEPESFPRPRGAPFGIVPPGHLHAHGIVVVPPGFYVDYSWLHGLQVCAGIDGDFGNVDVKRGRIAGGVDGVWGYVGGYLQKLKEDRSSAWFRRLGQNLRTVEKTGWLRGTTAVRRSMLHGVDLDADGEPELVRHLVRRQWRVRDGSGRELCDVDAAYRDAVRSLGTRGLLPSYIIGSPWLQDLRRYAELDAGHRTRSSKLPRLARAV